MNYFKIHQPTGTEYKLYYDKEDNFESKKKILEETILKHWEDYILEKWLYFGVFEIGKHNHEDKVKYMLDRCADFLLKGELNYEGLWIGDKKTINKIKALEGNFDESTKLQDSIYGSDVDESEYKDNAKVNFESEFYEKFIKPITKESNSTKVREWKRDSKKRQNRINRIETVIDFKKEYLSKWVSVNNQNEFVFDNKLFEIDGRVEQYQGELLQDGSVFYEQDKILCYKQFGKYHFFDMSYTPIVEILEKERV